jgi:manganese/zinc/iron transport system ATP- binding protein
MNVLTMREVTVRVANQTVLENINLEVPRGKLCAIIGPNGAGKSTLIRTVMGMMKPTAGDIQLFGEPLAAQKARIGYVPQRESVDWDFPIHVLDVVLMGTFGRLGLWRRPGRCERALALQCLEKMGIAELAERQISELSGGQQQRVFLARALAQQATVYFLDEPFVGVDAQTERNIIIQLQDLKAAGTSLFVVHHDLQTVPEYFDYVILLNRNLVAVGPVDEVFQMENLQKTYGGTLHFLRASLTDEKV